MFYLYLESHYIQNARCCATLQAKENYPHKPMKYQTSEYFLIIFQC